MLQEGRQLNISYRQFFSSDKYKDEFAACKAVSSFYDKVVVRS
jgi:hypothetical protein